MRGQKWLVSAVSIVGVLVLQAQARAQLCQQNTTVGCGSMVTGDNCPGSSCPDQATDYDCLFSSMTGPEIIYRFDAVLSGQVSVDVTENDCDLGLIALDGACDPSTTSCLDGSDNWGDEHVEFQAVAGQTFYLVVDGYGGVSCSFQLTVDCNTCQDQDGDGYFAPDPVLCPWGDDCSDGEPAINPDATEICGDGIDQDCDGSDLTCPYCAPAADLACEEPLAANTGDPAATDLVVDYSCLLYPENGRELAYRFAAQADTLVRIRLQSAAADLSLAVLPGDGNCDGSLCLTGADQILGPGEETVWLQASAGLTYFVVVDSWSSTPADFTLIVDCTGCADADQDGHQDATCGGNDCDDQDPAVYPGAAELCDGLDNDCDGTIDQSFDLQSDPDHCGACPTACLPAQVCDGGQCADACSGGLTNCNRACVDLSAHVDHCGDCRRRCAFTNGAAVCQQGSCVLDSCNTGFGDCNTDAADGCETDLATDLLNCGHCLQACPDLPHAQTACQSGHCIMGPCAEGFANCNQISRDGCEQDLASDNSNCGSCGHGCVLPAFCFAGNCTESCPEGLNNCNGQCMDVSADPRNCGGCGLTCLFPHATEPSCQTGQCLLGICETGFGNCNGDPLDGCETLLGSAEHCRSCADVCRYPHQTGSCVQGACQPATCDAGYRDCNADALDGCETHTAEDSANCGGCDAPCERLEVCSAGICVLGCPDGDDDGHSKKECGGDDCDDSDRAIYPDAAELCDGQDNDCDDAIDEGFDQDADQMTSCGTGTNPDCCDSGTENSLGCIPQSAAGIHPDAAEICGDGIDQDCDGSDLPCICLDSDGDGYKEKDCGGKDCDDTDPDIRPGAEELCDEIDNDCDSLTDEDDVCATGSGCSCAHGPGPAPALGLALSLLALLVLRKRIP